MKIPFHGWWFETKFLSTTFLFIFFRCLDIHVFSEILFIKPGIQERVRLHRNSGECSKRFWEILRNIPGNAQKDLGGCRGDSRECSESFREGLKRFRGIFKNISGNFWKDCGKCSERFRETFGTIPGNVRKDSGGFSKSFQGKLEILKLLITLKLWTKVSMKTLL